MSALVGRAPTPAQLHTPQLHHAAPAIVTYAYPQAAEKAIDAGRVDFSNRLDAAMSRLGKSPDLIGALISGIENGRAWCTHARAVATVRALAAEERLSAANLYALAWTITRHISRTGELDDVLVSVCAHPLAGDATIIYSLWTATAKFTTDVAQASGSLLPGATWWVRRKLGKTALCMGVGIPTREQESMVAEVADRWARRAGNNDALLAMVATSSLMFTDEDEMFATAEAICAPATAPEPAP